MKIKYAFFTLLALLASCSKSKVADPQPVCFFYGDSITFGYGASVPNNRWTSKLCIQKGWLETNYGTPYETLIQASENFGRTTFFGSYKIDILTKPANGKYIFIAYGMNDCGYNLQTTHRPRFQLNFKRLLLLPIVKAGPMLTLWCFADTLQLLTHGPIHLVASSFRTVEPT
jgi:hypothetical protein